MALLVVIAGLSVPAILRMVSNTGLDKGAEMLRAEMARARVMAIRTGKVQALLLTPGGSQIFVQDFDSVAETKSLPSQTSGNFSWGDGVLPKGVVFVSGETMETSRSTFETEKNAGSFDKSNRPILFYPDGTCQDAQVKLQNAKGNMKQVTLRGLTGTSRVSIPTRN